MSVQYFDINDQYNKKNLELAQKEHDAWKEFCKNNPCPYKAMSMIPEEDEEAVEVKR